VDIEDSNRRRRRSRHDRTSRQTTEKSNYNSNTKASDKKINKAPIRAAKMHSNAILGDIHNFGAICEQKKNEISPTIDF
jgi:hypothetical protein